MENKNPINGSVIEAVIARAGKHEYEKGNPEVIELAFRGYNTSYIQVVDLKAARSLMNQLRDLLPPNYQEL